MELSDSGLGGSGGAPAMEDVDVAVGFAALVVVVNAAGMLVQSHFAMVHGPRDGIHVELDAAAPRSQGFGGDALAMVFG